MLTLVVVLALVAAVVGWLAWRRRRGRSGPPLPRIDPFAVSEPWRHFVRGSLQARNRFDQAVAAARPGPLRERLESIRTRVHALTDECWTTARRAHEVARARARIDPSAAAESTARLDAELATAETRLRQLEAHLEEAAGRAVELASRADQPAALESGEDLVIEMESLRRGLDEVDGTES